MRKTIRVWAGLAFALAVLVGVVVYFSLTGERTVKRAEGSSWSKVQAIGDVTEPIRYAGRYSAVAGEADITVSEVSPGILHVTGLATWHNADGVVNTGDIDGDVSVSGNEAVYRKDECEVRLTFETDGLTAEDSLRCGGLNVTFSDRYVRP